MRILPYPCDPFWFCQPTPYGTMTMEEIRRRLDEMADEAARALAEERAMEGRMGGVSCHDESPGHEGAHHDYVTDEAVILHDIRSLLRAILAELQRVKP